LELLIESLENDVTRAALIGRLDIQGAAKIDIRMSVLAGSQRKVVFDLSELQYLASMGIRSLVMAAKTINAKGGRAVLLNPTPEVENVLKVSAIDSIIPIFHDLEAAKSAVSG